MQADGEVAAARRDANLITVTPSPSSSTPSNLRISNNGATPLRLRGARDSFALEVRLDRSVVYEGSGYAAPPREFRVGCWRNAWDAGDAAVDDTHRADASDNCSVPARISVMTSPTPSPGPDWLAVDDGGGGAFSSQIQVFAAFSDRSVAFRFGRARKNQNEEEEEREANSTSPSPSPSLPDADADAVTLCAGCTLAVGKLSLYHQHWLAFERGVLRPDPEASATGPSSAVSISLGDHERGCPEKPAWEKTIRDAFRDSRWSREGRR
jgi:hypothetical protein